MKSVCLLLVILGFNGCSVGVATYTVQKADYSEFVFSFQRGLWPNTYYLKIKNRSPNRTVSFFANENDHYIVEKNGAQIPLDVRGVGWKGWYWLNPGQTGTIPYKIEKRVIKNAAKVVFKGTVFIEKREGSFVEPTDQRAITITYHFDTRKIDVEIGTEILPEPQSPFFLNNEPNGRVNEDPLEKGIDIDEFRLRDNLKKEDEGLYRLRY